MASTDLKDAADGKVAYLLECARQNGALEGDEKALEHLLREAYDAGYWAQASGVKAEP